MVQHITSQLQISWLCCLVPACTKEFVLESTEMSGGSHVVADKGTHGAGGVSRLLGLLGLWGRQEGGRGGQGCLRLLGDPSRGDRRGVRGGFSIGIPAFKPVIACEQYMRASGVADVSSCICQEIDVTPKPSNYYCL